jgi:uncharacterized protein (TIGR02246 family)
MTDKSDLIREAIIKANQTLETTFRRGDPAAIAHLYTEDAILLPTGSEPIKGTSAIRDFWQAVLGTGIEALTVETREVDQQGATVIEMGEYTLRKGGAPLDRGKYIVIWKLIQGEWKLHRDMWNSNLSQE